MNNEHQNVFFGPRVIQTKTIEQLCLIYILIVIFYLVHMKVNFAAIFDFSFKFTRQ